jgi:hypothetical protein
MRYLIRQYETSNQRDAVYELIRKQDIHLALNTFYWYGTHDAAAHERTLQDMGLTEMYGPGEMK